MNKRFSHRMHGHVMFAAAVFAMLFLTACPREQLTGHEMMVRDRTAFIKEKAREPGGISSMYDTVLEQLGQKIGQSGDASLNKRNVIWVKPILVNGGVDLNEIVVMQLTKVADNSGGKLVVTNDGALANLKEASIFQMSGSIDEVKNNIDVSSLSTLDTSPEGFGVTTEGLLGFDPSIGGDLSKKVSVRLPPADVKTLARVRLTLSLAYYDGMTLSNKKTVTYTLLVAQLKEDREFNDSLGKSIEIAQPGQYDEALLSSRQRLVSCALAHLLGRYYNIRAWDVWDASKFPPSKEQQQPQQQPPPPQQEQQQQSKKTVDSKSQDAIILFNKGANAQNSNDYNGAASAYDEFISQYGDDQSPEIRKLVARAMSGRGIVLNNLGRPDEANAVYDELYRRFAADPSSEIRGLVISALHSKGNTLIKGTNFDATIATYDAIIRLIGDPPASDQMNNHLIALINKTTTTINKGNALRKSNSNDAAVAVYDQIMNDNVINRYATGSPALWAGIATAMDQKCFLINNSPPDGSTRSCDCYRGIVERFGAGGDMNVNQIVAKARKYLSEDYYCQTQQPPPPPPPPPIVTGNGQSGKIVEPPPPPPTPCTAQKAKEMVDQGRDLADQSHIAQAIAVWNTVIGQCGADQTPAVRQQVANALNKKGFRLRQQGQSAEALKAYEEIINRYSNDQAQEMRDLVSGAILWRDRLRGGK